MTADKSTATAIARRPSPGRPFKPGQSGNPGGRPKGLCASVHALVGVDGTKLTQALWLILQGRPADRRAFFGEVVKVSTRDRLDAVQVLLDRGFGKSTQTVELTGADGGPVKVIEWRIVDTVRGHGP